MPARTKSLNSKGSNKNMHGAEQEQNEMHIKNRKSNENLEDITSLYFDGKKIVTKNMIQKSNAKTLRVIDLSFLLHGFLFFLY